MKKGEANGRGEKTKEGDSPIRNPTYHHPV